MFIMSFVSLFQISCWTIYRKYIYYLYIYFVCVTRHRFPTQLINIIVIILSFKLLNLCTTIPVGVIHSCSFICWTNFRFKQQNNMFIVTETGCFAMFGILIRRFVIYNTLTITLSFHFLLNVRSLSYDCVSNIVICNELVFTNSIFLTFGQSFSIPFKYFDHHFVEIFNNVLFSQ